MIPEVAAVVEAARYLIKNTDVIGRWEAPLAEALAALDARSERPAGQSEMEEQDRTWDEVVTGDEILSVKTGRWYPVAATARTPEGQARVMLKGSAKPITRAPADPVRLRRGVDGDAADLFMVLWSGQSRAETVGTQEDEPMAASEEE
ncbi:MAG TPA: hypothetical protein VFG99_09520 [Chloroflexia bacterium]|nr:hypothetical protein [Chloroflexia bacterium]